MVAALEHRGPDERGAHVDGPVGLGHAHLIAEMAVKESI